MGNSSGRINQAITGYTFYMKVLVVVTAMFVTSPAGAEWTEWILNADMEGSYEDNINLAGNRSFAKSEYTVLPALSVGRYYQLGDYTRLRLAGDFRGSIHSKYHKLDDVESVLNIAVIHKFGVGSGIPWVRLFVKPSYLSAKDDAREGFLLSTGFGTGIRLSERLDVSAGYKYSLRDAKDRTSPMAGIPGDVFDQSAHSANVVGNFLVINDLILSVGYELRYGDMAVTIPKSAYTAVRDFISAVTKDDTYGETGWWTYKMRGTSRTYSFGLGYALSNHTSLNVLYSKVNSAAGQWVYSGNLAVLSFKYSY